MRFNRGALGALCIAALAGGSLAVGVTTATAEPVEQVTICHRTNSDTHPYDEVTPDVAGVLDGHDGHTGPAWDPTLKASHVKWGDIIPPFEYDGGSYPGMNWDAAGQAILASGCVPPAPPEPPEQPEQPEQQYGSLALQKSVLGLPIVGTTVGGAIPSSFAAHVACDDGTAQDVTFPSTGGSGTPAQIDHIEAGSVCTVVELGTAGFPTGSVVSYGPAVASTTGVTIAANATTQVAITNDFRGVQVESIVVVKPVTPADPVTPLTPIDPVTPATPGASAAVVAPVAAAPAAVPTAPIAVVATPAFTG